MNGFCFPFSFCSPGLVQLRASFDEMLKQVALPSPARIGFMANEGYMPDGVKAGEGAVLVSIVREPHSRILSE